MSMANVYLDPYSGHPKCPFCGRKALGEVAPLTYREGGKRITTSAYIYCMYSNCGARGPQKDTVEGAWAAWDGRL